MGAHALRSLCSERGLTLARTSTVHALRRMVIAIATWERRYYTCSDEQRAWHARVDRAHSGRELREVCRNMQVTTCLKGFPVAEIRYALHSRLRFNVNQNAPPAAPPDGDGMLPLPLGPDDIACMDVLQLCEAAAERGLSTACKSRSALLQAVTVWERRYADCTPTERQAHASIDTSTRRSAQVSNYRDYLHSCVDSNGTYPQRRCAQVNRDYLHWCVRVAAEANDTGGDDGRAGHEMRTEADPEDHKTEVSPVDWRCWWFLRRLARVVVRGRLVGCEHDVVMSCAMLCGSEVVCCRGLSNPSPEMHTSAPLPPPPPDRVVSSSPLPRRPFS
jgi:hypothetical protein